MNKCKDETSNKFNFDSLITLDVNSMYWTVMEVNYKFIECKIVLGKE